MNSVNEKVSKWVLLTNSFPFGKGEEFIETEIRYWSEQSKNVELFILPKNKEGVVRNHSGTNLLLVDYSKYNKIKVLFLLLGILSPYFFREIFYLFSSRKASIKNIKKSLISIAYIYRKAMQLREVLTKKQIRYAYSYWNTEISYALILLKKVGVLDKVVSRTHGYDIYEDVNDGYLPFKRQFINAFDNIYSISEAQKKYIEVNYSAINGLVKLGRLGVEFNGIRTKSNESEIQHDVISILSVSSCVEVKNLFYLIDSIGEYSSLKVCSKKVKWRHIGDGPLFQELNDYAHKVLKATVDYKFLGAMKNSDVLDYIDTHVVDLFVNCSRSEGVPVSIMEAMSRGICCIAPDVGGVSELLEPTSCILTKKDSSDLVESMIAIEDECKLELNKRQCYDHVFENFNAEANYKKFISDLLL